MMAALLMLIQNELTMVHFYYSRGKLVSRNESGRRGLHTSLYFGDGDCKWQTPNYNVPEDLDFYKSLIAGFPGGDKRMVWMQMEALAGWPAKDEWDFAPGNLGMSNHPFIKANYPHHEGFWGWESAADQTVMIVSYIRRSMVEYHDVLWDLGFPTEWEHPDIREQLLYTDQTPEDSWYEWRDLRVLDEVMWWGWFIDYWMEGGLLRDVFTHQLITLEHWSEIIANPFSTREQFAEFGDPDVVADPAYDPHCVNGDISRGCAPVEVISVDRLLDHTRGPTETAKIATALLSNSTTGDYVIAQQAWDCIWEELIIHRKGPKTIYDRPGYTQESYVNSEEHNFSLEMLNEMLKELNRLTAKYNGQDWNNKAAANRLVELLMEHTFHLQVEVNEVKAGTRKLTDKGFLGPKTREARRKEKVETTSKSWSNVFRRQLTEDDHKALNNIGQRRFTRKRQEAMNVTRRGGNNEKPTKQNKRIPLR